MEVKEKDHESVPVCVKPTSGFISVINLTKVRMPWIWPFGIETHRERSVELDKTDLSRAVLRWVQNCFKDVYMNRDWIKLLLILWINNSVIHWNPPLGMRLPVITVTFAFLIKRLSSDIHVAAWTQTSGLLLSNLYSILFSCSSWFPFLLARVLWSGYFVPNVKKT